MCKSILPIYSKLLVISHSFKQVSPFSTSTICTLIQKYRKEKGLPLNPNSYGPLTDLPDYTYLDGKPTPLGINQKRRMLKCEEITRQIIQLSKEMDFAVERHADMVKNEKEAKDKILANKLKSKGHLLLKENQ